jgi:putative nucleotidyltransferase with HDIG domain
VLIAALLNYRLAVVAGFFTAAVTALMVSPAQGFELTFRWFAVAAVSGLLIRNVSNYRAYFIKTFFSSFVLTLLINFYYLFQNRAIWLKLAPDMLLITAGMAFACAVAAQVLIFIMELVFNIDTDMALMVLADYNHPLLERLKREAPGTMFHSMTVATLAEDAANAIGANPLRAKVAGLYHDIGKLALPQYFTENNRDSSAEHLKLNPQLSSIIIRDHVKEGLILAHKHRLFRWIRGAISTHHGDDLVHYFYARAKSVSSDAVVESQFRYNGQPPRSKELTILSLADACEAASRSLDKPTPQKIQALVEDIFIHRCTGGQLRSSELTLAEFEQVKKSFITTLVSIHHGRIAYTPENMNEKSSLQLEKQ